MISPNAGIKDYFESRNLPVNINLVSGADTKSKSNLLYIGYFEVEKTDGSVQHYDATQFSACSEGITVGSGMGEEEQHARLAWTEQAKCGDAVLLHGDLKGENVIPTGDGVVLLDWQRPILGPETLEEELALLLSDRESWGEGAALARFVMGYWYAWAYRTCLPYPFVLGMAKKHLRGVLILIST